MNYPVPPYRDRTGGGPPSIPGPNDSPAFGQPESPFKNAWDNFHDARTNFAGCPALQAQHYTPSYGGRSHVEPNPVTPWFENPPISHADAFPVVQSHPTLPGGGRDPRIGNWHEQDLRESRRQREEAHRQAEETRRLMDFATAQSCLPKPLDVTLAPKVSSFQDGEVYQGAGNSHFTRVKDDFHVTVEIPGLRLGQKTSIGFPVSPNDDLGVGIFQVGRTRRPLGRFGR